tara:strand:- start:1226 stop:1396 length:171 start_codon:yes stop_codon:yes gene_type:complete
MKLSKQNKNLVLDHCGCEINTCDCGYHYKVSLDENPLKNVGFNRKFPWFTKFFDIG